MSAANPNRIGPYHAGAYQAAETQSIIPTRGDQPAYRRGRRGWRGSLRELVDGKWRRAGTCLDIHKTKKAAVECARREARKRVRENRKEGGRRVR